jgi:hypothetical protein
MIALIATVTWRRDYKHLAPGGLFAALIAIDFALLCAEYICEKMTQAAAPTASR